MMVLFRLLLFVTCVIYTVGQVPNTGPGAYGTTADTPKKRFEYKYSFKGPYLAQKDGKVPFWSYIGSTIASEDMVRITPSLKSQKGSIWTELPTAFDWWEIDVHFRVNGRGRLGADGLAVWYTAAKYAEGPVFGSSDYWTGLGVFFDSFDNDGKGNNPHIMAMVNDGTKSYQHDNDGINQQLAGCLRDFRNKPFPVRAKIEYYKNVLSLSFSNGNTNADDDYELCFRVEQVFLPKVGYFGISAATGGLADDHDVLKFLTRSLHAPGSPIASAATVAPIADQERERADKEYEAHKEKLQKQREEYLRQHPDEAKKLKEHEAEDPEHEYESLGERELAQIFHLSSSMFEAIKNLNRKLDEVLGRQHTTISLLSSGAGVAQVGVPQVGVPPPPGHQQPPHVIPPPIQRHEVDNIINLQQELVRTTRELKQLVAGGSGQPQPASVTQGQEQLLISVRDTVKVLESQLMRRNANIGCATNCISSLYFALFIIAQTVTFMGYFIYKNNFHGSHKKFY